MSGKWTTHTQKNDTLSPLEWEGVHLMPGNKGVRLDNAALLLPLHLQPGDRLSHRVHPIATNPTVLGFLLFFFFFYFYFFATSALIRGVLFWRRPSLQTHLVTCKLISACRCTQRAFICKGTRSFKDTSISTGRLPLASRVVLHGRLLKMTTAMICLLWTTACFVPFFFLSFHFSRHFFFFFFCVQRNTRFLVSLPYRCLFIFKANGLPECCPSRSFPFGIVSSSQGVIISA